MPDLSTFVLLLSACVDADTFDRGSPSGLSMCVAKVLHRVNVDRHLVS